MGSATSMPQPLSQDVSQQTSNPDCAIVLGAERGGQVVVVCEHASNLLPQGLGNLGLSPAQLESHIAWDPGAAGVARVLAEKLNSPAVLQKYSRVVYDCNRPPSSPDAMRAVSEKTRIPGNENLEAAEKKRRTEEIYEPFHQAVADLLDQRDAPVLVTVHSFTPVFMGKPRKVGVGLLHDEDSRLADAVLALDGFDQDIVVKRNEPYGPEDGVTHSLQRHGIKRGILNLMVEIRNDLIKNEAEQQLYGTLLADLVQAALKNMGRKGI